jgi:outer membrane protein
MRAKRMTAERSMIWVSAKRLACRVTLERLAAFVRPVVAGGLALTLACGPAFAQDPQQQQPTPPSEQKPLPTPQSPAQGAYAPAPTNPPIPVSLGVSQYNYSKAPHGFPNLIAPYRPIRVPEPVLINSPRIDQLIHDNKLELTLQDAVELALENSMDIAVQRYYPWMADTDILSAKAGGFPVGIPGAAVRFSNANIPFINYDPTYTGLFSLDDRRTPINNGFIAGLGATATVQEIASHSAQYNNQVSQGFSTGTTATVAWNNVRSSSNARNFFNPAVTSSLVVSIQQQLLNGFGTFANRRNIVIAKNNRKLADFAFSQQAITTVTSTITAYWELAFARQFVNVQQQAVLVAQKLYEDNRKQLEIGTMAPLDVTRAESELATDRQNLIVAQTVKLQDEQILKNAISKDPLAANLINVEIIPTDKQTPPEMTEAPTFEDAVKEAFQKRPELLEQEINIKNAAIDAKAQAIALRPTATLFAQYTTQGLAGNSVIPGVGVNEQGFSTAQSQIFHNQFPDYLVGVNVQVPLRNRLNQANDQWSLLRLRQVETQMRQLQNAALLDVRNSYIALEQDRARVDAARKARELQQQTFDAEQKKYQLGASTVYQVILTQRDLITAQANELRALSDLLEAKAGYERAVGRTLEVNRVTIADATHGEIERDTLIPGTLHGKVVGTEDLFTSGHR